MFNERKIFISGLITRLFFSVMKSRVISLNKIIYKAFINGEIFADKIMLADNFSQRLVGLLDKKKLDSGEGLLINKCKQVHTFFMKFNIDVIFLSNDDIIVAIENDFKKSKISGYEKKAFKVLELKAGEAEKFKIKINDHIKFVN